MLEATRGSLTVAVAVILGFVAPAVAQTPAVEISGSYQAPYDHSIEKWFPIGWSVDVAANLNDTWGVIAQVGRAARSEGDLDIDLDLYTFGGGTRWSHRTMSRVVPLHSSSLAKHEWVAKLIFRAAKLAFRRPGGWCSPAAE